jgi:hypothetical protein
MQGSHSSSVFHCAQKERNQSNADDYQRKFTGPDQAIGRFGESFFNVKKFVDGEAEADQRSRRPDPGHHGPIVSDSCTVIS